jgi:hypothetical protein
MNLILCSNSEILRFEEVKVLSVKRFDRQWDGARLLRVPQEDLCQALSVAPGRKYESDGGPGIAQILSLLNESDERDHDRRIFLKTQVLFWLLSAIDGHAKNFPPAKDQVLDGGGKRAALPDEGNPAPTLGTDRARKQVSGNERAHDRNRGSDGVSGGAGPGLFATGISAYRE